MRVGPPPAFDETTAWTLTAPAVLAPDTATPVRVIVNVSVGSELDATDGAAARTRAATDVTNAAAAVLRMDRCMCTPWVGMALLRSVCTPQPFRDSYETGFRHETVAFVCDARAVKTLRLSLLGTPLIEVDGAPLSVDTRKAVAMLAFLAVTGHAHSRAVLADLLWPELDGERAGAALRRTLSALRAGLGDGRLHSDRTSISLELADASFDLPRARAIAADPSATLHELREACESHRDDLLAGFVLRDSVRFDDWLRDAQDEISRERAALLDRLIDTLAAAGRPDEAVARARERLTLDELHEPTHRRLIELYAAAGRRGDALSQYRECVRVLDRELGVPPLAETTDLYNAVSAGAPVPSEPDPATEPALSGELMLVGRDRELARVLEAHAAIGRDGAFVVIDGESGVGKTRLAEEALNRLRARDVRVLTARPGAGEQGLAYGVVAAVLRAALSTGDLEVPATLRADGARLLPELGDPPASSLEEPGAQTRFLEAISELIELGCGAGTGVVFIDDLQWCDPASLGALAYLARRLTGRPLLLLCARRSDEPDPDHAFARLAVIAERIPLARLRRDDVRALASALGLDEVASERVFRESEGLPLFVSELLTVGGDHDGDGPGGVRAVIDARLDAVSEMASQVLGAAAIVGRRVEPEYLRAVSGRSEEEVAVALEELCARGLVIELDTGYDFSHERLRAVAEERIGRARRRLLHSRAAEMLALRHGDHAVIARHFELAGDDARAAAQYVAAGDDARALSGWMEAIAHYEAALALGHADPAQLQEAIGDVHALRGEYGVAIASFDSAAALGAPSATGRLEHKLGAVYERRGDWELAENHYALALDGASDPDRAAILADRSRAAWRRGEREHARTLAFEALALAERAGARDAAARANNILGLLGCGREYLERSIELSALMSDPSVRIAALNNLALDHVAAGELDVAQALTRQALELCIAQGDRHHEAALRNNLADILHKAGDREGSMAELKEAVAAFAAIGSEGESLYPGVWSLVEW